MTTESYIGFGVLIVAIITLVVKVSFVLNKKVSYESLDRCKKEVMDMFVHKDVFQITVTGIKDDVSEIKKDVKELLRKANGKVSER
jgi:uncharacterized protein YoxC